MTDWQPTSGPEQSPNPSLSSRHTFSSLDGHDPFWSDGEAETSVDSIDSPPPPPRYQLSDPTSGLRKSAHFPSVATATGDPSPYPRSSMSTPTATGPFCPPVFRLTHDKNLPFLIPLPIAYERFLPWAEPGLDLGAPKFVPYRSDTPPWSLTLESYYQIFHPCSWDILEEEFANQAEYAMRMKEWIEHREWTGAGQEELAALRVERIKAVNSLFTIFSGLYGLHFIRERYLEHYRPIAPMWDDARIIQETLDFELGLDRQELVFGGPRDHSVWPLPLPVSIIPPAPFPLTDNRNSLIRLCDLSADACRPYWLPLTSAAYARRFTAPTEAFFLDLYTAKTPSSVTATSAVGSGGSGASLGSVGSASEGPRCPAQTSLSPELRQAGGPMAVGPGGTVRRRLGFGCARDASGARGGDEGGQS